MSGKKTLDTVLTNIRRELFDQIYPKRDRHPIYGREFGIINKVCDHQLWQNSFPNAYMVQNEWKETQWT
jgi:hypothetical protein